MWCVCVWNIYIFLTCNFSTVLSNNILFWLFCSAFVFSLTVFLTMLFLLLILIPEFPWPSQIRLSPQIVKSSPKPLLGGVSAWAVFPNSLIIPRGYITLHRGGYSLIFLQKKSDNSQPMTGVLSIHHRDFQKVFLWEKKPFTFYRVEPGNAWCRLFHDHLWFENLNKGNIFAADCSMCIHNSGMYLYPCIQHKTDKNKQHVSLSLFLFPPQLSLSLTCAIFSLTFPPRVVIKIGTDYKTKLCKV